METSSNYFLTFLSLILRNVPIALILAAAVLPLRTTSLYGSEGELLVAMGTMFVVRRHEIDYARAAIPSEEISEETWVELARGARSVRRSRFLRSEGGELLVEDVIGMGQRGGRRIENDHAGAGFFDQR